MSIAWKRAKSRVRRLGAHCLGAASEYRAREVRLCTLQFVLSLLFLWRSWSSGGASDAPRFLAILPSVRTHPSTTGPALPRPRARTVQATAIARLWARTRRRPTGGTPKVPPQTPMREPAKGMTRSLSTPQRPAKAMAATQALGLRATGRRRVTAVRTAGTARAVRAAFCFATAAARRTTRIIAGPAPTTVPAFPTSPAA